MRILVANTLLPRPDTASGHFRLVWMLQLLGRVATLELSVAETRPAKGDPDLRYWETLEGAGIRVLGGGVPALLGRIRETVYDVLLVEFWHLAEVVAPPVRKVQPWVRTIVDSVDVHYLREEAAADLGLLDAGEVALRKQRELAVYRGADAVIAVTGEDRKSLENEGGMPEIEVVSNVVRIRPRNRQDRGPVLLFIGGFRHPPNADAVLWFVGEILPQIRDHVPAAVLQVVGSCVPQEILDLDGTPGVQVVGHVPDTALWLETAAVSVAPLRYGAGMKGKVTEAMAAGVPVVTTRFGAQGLGAVSGDQLLVADDARAFADAVVRCLTAPEWAAELGLRGQRHIAQICGEDTVAKTLTELVRRVAGRGGPWYAPWRLLAHRTVRRLLSRR